MEPEGAMSGEIPKKWVFLRRKRQYIVLKSVKFAVGSPIFGEWAEKMRNFASSKRNCAHLWDTYFCDLPSHQSTLLPQRNYVITPRTHVQRILYQTAIWRPTWIVLGRRWHPIGRECEIRQAPLLLPLLREMSASTSLLPLLAVEVQPCREHASHGRGTASLRIRMHDTGR